MKMDVLEKYSTPEIELVAHRQIPILFNPNKKLSVVPKSDCEIWDAFRSGDEKSYEQMFKCHYTLLLNYGLRFSDSREDVKDYIQLLFSKLWESRENLGANNSIKGYLLASLRRMILRGSKSSVVTFDIANIQSSISLTLSVENLYVSEQRERENCHYISKLLLFLPHRQKEAIYLKYYGGHSFSEIAEIMGITTRVVYKLIYKALDKLSMHVVKNENVN
jgi:RNA polymerase sigma factor (sigma-70 family)